MPNEVVCTIRSSTHH